MSKIRYGPKLNKYRHPYPCLLLGWLEIWAGEWECEVLGPHGHFLLGWPVVVIAIIKTLSYHYGVSQKSSSSCTKNKERVGCITTLKLGLSTENYARVIYDIFAANLIYEGWQERSQWLRAKSSYKAMSK